MWRAGALLTSIPALALPAAALAASADGEILALEADVQRLKGNASDIEATRADPLEEMVTALAQISIKTEFAVGVETTCEAAVGEVADIDSQIDALIERLIALPAQSNVGRAAKARVLVRNILPPDWREALSDGDIFEERALAIIAELAGVAAADLIPVPML